MPTIELITDDKGTLKLLDTADEKYRQLGKTASSEMATVARATQAAERELSKLGSSGGAALLQISSESSKATKELAEMVSKAKAEDQFVKLGSYAKESLFLIGSESSKTTKELSEMVGKATMVAQAFLFGGPAASAITIAGAALGALLTQMDRAAEEAQKALAPYENLRQSLAETDRLSDKLAQSFRDRFNVDKQTALNMADLARSNVTYNAAATAQTMKEEQMVRTGLDLAAAKRELYYAQVGQQSAAGEGEAAQAGARAEVERAHVAVDTLTAKLTNLSNERLKGINDLAQEANDWKAVQDQVAKLPPTMDEYIAAGAKIQADDWMQYQYNHALKLQKALEDLAKTEHAIVMGAVEKALTPTEVKAEDFLPGRMDAWDEWRRRAEDVARNGVDASKYGANFANSLRLAMQHTGLGAGELSGGFKDFSLFGAHPEFITEDFLNFDALDADIERQMDAMLGKAQVMQAAYSRVWEKIAQDPVKATKLEKLGLSGMPDEWQTIMGMKPSEFKIIASPDFTQKLMEIQSAITSTIPPELHTTVHVEYKFDQPGGGSGDDGGNGEGSADINVPAGCFLGETLVSVAQGERPIAEVGPGDLVWVYDVTSPNPLAQAQVITRHDFEREDLVTVVLLHAEVHCSPEHPWLTADRGFVEAAQLEPGSQVVTATGRDTVQRITPYPGCFAVYDMTVDHPSHTYLVQGGHVVHNKIMMQHGGFGVLDRDTLIYAHRGEPYWFGGVNGETPFPGGGDQTNIVVNGANKSPRQIAWEVANEFRRRQR